MAETLTASPHLSEPRDFISLMKPRVMSLVIFTGFIGMVLAPDTLAPGAPGTQGTPHPLLLMISLCAIAAGAGAAGAINHWYDRDIDAVMRRTALRPIPSGKVLPEEALTLGLVIAPLSVLVLWFSGGIEAALLLGFTIFFYGVIYTMWLKRVTAQNIVIGGAAGAFPPAIGWLAAGGGMSVEPVLLFAMIFIWTPPHFWALALARRDDYVRAGIPMMPVVAGRRATRAQILLYALALAPLGVMPWYFGMASVFYGVLAAALGVIFAAKAWRLWVSDSDADAMALFRFSILYLFLIFLGLGVDALLIMSGGG